MNGVVSILIVSVWISFAGCCSSKTAQKSGEAAVDTAKSSLPLPAKRTAIVQNVSRVDAVIEALTMVDQSQFSLKIFIVKSEPFTGKYSLIEPEQRVTVFPQFVFAGDGFTVDTTNVNNQKLLSLRSAKVGESFRGKISIDQKGLWRLLEIEDR